MSTVLVEKTVTLPTRYSKAELDGPSYRKAAVLNALKKVVPFMLAGVGISLFLYLPSMGLEGFWNDFFKGMSSIVSIATGVTAGGWLREEFLNAREKHYTELQFRHDEYRKGLDAIFLQEFPQLSERRYSFDLFNITHTGEFECGYRISDTEEKFNTAKATLTETEMRMAVEVEAEDKLTLKK